MAEEQEEKKTPTSSSSFDIHKWLPYILLIGQWLIGYGRDSSGTTAMKAELDSDKASIAASSKEQSDVLQRLTRVEANVETMTREKNQERIYSRGK